jgi:hypothetical protein
MPAHKRIYKSSHHVQRGKKDRSIWSLMTIRGHGLCVGSACDLPAAGLLARGVHVGVGTEQPPTVQAIGLTWN